MMQFTKIIGGIKCFTTTVTTLLIVTYISESAANTQFDITQANVIGEDSVGSKRLNKSIIIPNINFYGSYKLASKVFLLFNEKCDIISPFNYGRDTANNKLNPISERYVLSSNNTELGLRFTGLGNAEISLRNILYMDTMSINSNLIPHAYDYPQDRLTLDSIASGSIMYDRSQTIRKMRSNAGLFWDVPLGHFDLKADVNYFLLNSSNILKYNNYIDNDSIVNSLNVTDLNQMADISVRYNLPNDLDIEAGAFINQDLSGHSYTNLYRYRLFSGGNHSFPAGNKITWKAGTEWYMRASDNSMPETYASDLKSTFVIPSYPWCHLYLRDVYTIAWGLFLKATAIADLGEGLFKQRYEIALHKAWENSSCIDAGYYAAINGVFPMQGTYLQLSFFPIPVLKFSGATKFLWEQSATYNEMGGFSGYKYLFLKNISSGELAFKTSDNVSFFGGIDYTYFNRINSINDVYPARFALFAGIRGYL